VSGGTERPAPGAWPSPISAERLVQGAVGISEAVPDGDTVWWLESRPAEAGRAALMHGAPGRPAREITPPGANVRTTVHEYGGGAWWAEGGVVWYVDHADQRLRRLDGTAEDGTGPLLLTAAPSTPGALRYAEPRPTPDRHWLVAVCERHQGVGEPRNLLVAIANDGSERTVELVSGPDFVGPARVSPAGDRLAWIEWDHPNMPWDDTRLRVAELHLDGPDGIAIGPARTLAGGDGGVAILQPEFAPDGRLHWLSDATDAWQLYVEDRGAPVLEVDGEIGYPPWVFGLSRYAFRADGTPVAARYRHGIEHLQGFEGSTAFHAVRTSGDRLGVIAASFSEGPSVWLDGRCAHPAQATGLDAGFLPPPETLDFATGPDGGARAHALYYAPAHPDYTPDHRPGSGNPTAIEGSTLQNYLQAPLIVMAHGGPTSAARSQLNLAVRFWTSRGFGVVDVNYRGSSGFGRRYRKALDGAWGVIDVEDCVAAARHLIDAGRADPARLAIRGGSAGGFTVLCALAFHDVFAAGASLYGVADLEALAGDTHKFESCYLDGLVGPWPQMAERYRERSPIHHLDGFDTPMIVLQGSEDRVVPPNQSRMIVAALEQRGVPVEYLEFEGEAHGFRRSDTLITALEAELAFYRRTFGL